MLWFFRVISFFAALVVFFGWGAAPAWAQAPVEFPPYPLDPGNFRGPGFYFSLPKIVVLLVTFWLWTITTDWASRDCLRLKLNYALWNPLHTFLFLGAFGLLVFLLPTFVVGYPLLLLSYVGPLIAYVVYRNGKVQMHEKVLTKAHLRHVLAMGLSKVGIKISGEIVDPFEKGTAARLTARGGADSRENNVNLLTARQSPGFLGASEMMADAIEQRASAVMLDFNSEAVAIKYQIDGMWHDSDPHDRESGDAMLEVYKRLANLDPAQRTARQAGRLGIEYQGEKMEGRFNSQGTKTGERAIIQFEKKGFEFRTLDEIGMRPKLQEPFRELLRTPSGFVLLSALPGGGMTTLFDVALLTMDRYMRNVVAIEDKHHPDKEIENVEPHRYDGRADEDPATILPKVVRLYPDVIICRDLVDQPSVEFLCEQVKEKRLVVGGVRAKEASETLIRVLHMKVPAAKFAEAISAVVNVRLVRKLCEECKEPYPPSPELLKKLGIPAGRIEALYRPPQEPESVCQACHGIGYQGRTPLFEILNVDDQIRQLLVKSPKLELLRTAARKAGMRTFQEEGILLVAQGVTSLQELSRALK